MAKLSRLLENKFCTLIIITLLWYEIFLQESKLVNWRIFVISTLNKTGRSVYPTLTVEKGRWTTKLQLFSNPSESWVQRANQYPELLTHGYMSPGKNRSWKWCNIWQSIKNCLHHGLEWHCRTSCNPWQRRVCTHYFFYVDLHQVLIRNTESKVWVKWNLPSVK